ncbi:MAG: sulfurtransferase TusA family protein [Deltaproteobacteria bacterium]|nr:sulfurtransferase TusA family protein [Deltaproteobacteria bacterium]MBW2306705.1 sulfurtransferase TusA family protein [Deltaproteobacteria bacterium]
MHFDRHIHMGDKLCSELLVGLKQAISSLSGGQVLKVTAHAPGAGEDIKGWCELTEHRFLGRNGDEYFIQVKEA